MVATQEWIPRHVRGVETKSDDFEILRTCNLQRQKAFHVGAHIIDDKCWQLRRVLDQSLMSKAAHYHSVVFLERESFTRLRPKLTNILRPIDAVISFVHTSVIVWESREYKRRGCHGFGNRVVFSTEIALLVFFPKMYGGSFV